MSRDGPRGPLPSVSRFPFVSWVRSNGVVLGNVSALAGSTLVTSILGFAFWNVATRLFEPSAVGLSSAAVSLMTLLSSIGLLGLDTLMITELPKRSTDRGALLVTALMTSFIACVALWIATAVGGRSAGLLGGEMWGLVALPLFGLGVALGASGMILDQSLIGLLLGNVQLGRNTVFALTKLVALVGLGLVLTAADETSILVAWVVGLVVSIALLVLLAAVKRIRLAFLPRWSLLKRIHRETLKHHVLNLALFGPRLLLPVLVSVTVAPEANAAFYAALMIASFGFMIPTHFSTVLHAVGMGEPRSLGARLRFSLRLSLLLAVAAGAVLTLGAPLILKVFGAFYVETATGSLRILAWAIPGLALKMHLVAVERVRERVGRVALIMTGGALLELGLAALGATMAGIDGLSVGFVVAVTLQALPCIPALCRAMQARA